MPLTTGQTFAGYTIIRLLGSGGMGEVYLAQHPRLPRRDALKLLPVGWAADSEYRERFNREADLASTLWHPHIVGVHDRGEHRGQLWIALDFVDGLDAAQLLSTRYPAGMPATVVAPIVTAVASALDAAHKQGLLHRDVKPANIMLTHVGGDGEQRIMLTDFGIARNIDDISGLTATNMTVGTVAYCAPEQLLGDDLDGRADQYALAATAYHLLTGRPLFANSNPAVVISRHLNTAPPPLGDTRAELAALDPVIAAGLAKHPDDRFARCMDFARAFSEAIGSADSPLAAPTTPASIPRPDANPPPQAAPVASSTIARRKTAARTFAAVSVVAVAVIAIAIAILRPWQQSLTTSSQGVESKTSSSRPPSASIPPPSVSTSTAAPAALPDAVPTNSGCRGVVVAQKDIEHKFLGPVRIFLTLSGTSLDKVGCVASVTASGKVLPAIYVRVTDHFGFPSPATDTTGNTFVTYNPGRYDGVLVLVPSPNGFEDIGWESQSTASDPSYWGRLAIYYAELIGPGADGQYTIRKSSNDCDPNCAQGTVTDEDLRWDGADYVAAAPQTTTPPSQVVPSAPPSLNLESVCSNPEWRNTNGAEGDRLCGAPNPYG